jgi:hypothetical protein
VPDTDDEKPLKRGYARMRELSKQEAADRENLEAALIAELGRKPSTLDAVAVELFAATVARARRLRNVGKSDAEERTRAIQLIRATGLRPPPPTTDAAKFDIRSQLALAGYKPPVTTDDDDEDDIAEEESEPA